MIMAGKMKYPDGNLSQCVFFYDKYRLDWPGIGIGSLCQRPTSD
jgi:hypothetical protein